jgi:yecA family protein
VNLTTDGPLTDDEFDRLSEFLDAIGLSAMNIEMLDGYFSALISGPDMVPPSEYLPQIWGEDFLCAGTRRRSGATNRVRAAVAVSTSIAVSQTGRLYID